MFSSSKFQRLSGLWEGLQLFHATDFQSLMYPNFIFSRILGIFPYKISGSIFETYTTCNILRNFLFGAFCIYEVIVLHKIFVTKAVSNYNNAPNALQDACYYVFGGFIGISTYVLSGPRMRVLQAVLNISSRLSPESYRELSRWIHVKDILGTFFLIMQEITYYFKVSEHLTYYMLGIYVDLLILQVDMLYVNCVCVLKAYFKSVHDNLVHLQNVMVNDAPRGARLICDTQRNQSLLMKLKILKRQHLTISDTVKMLNVIFSLQLLATVTLTFTEITCHMYFLLVRWQSGLFSILYSAILNRFFSMYVAYLVLKLVLIVWACETAKKHAVAIGTTVHDVLNRTSDRQIKEELYLFSLQILHCGRNTFTMKGFTMDATLLATITGSITTYTLILAQFMIILHSCNNKIASNITQ